MLRCLFALVLFAATAVAASGGALARDSVDVALVLLADGSGSIDPEEHRLQREGYADALTSGAVLSAIRSNAHGRIAVAFVEWGAPDSQDVVVDWALIDGEASAKVVADRLRSAPKRSYGYNSISNAIDFAVRLLDSGPWAGERQVIDVSGDGPNIGGRPILAARDAALARGITINALAIRQPGSDVALRGRGLPPLEDYYRDNVIGGPGAFVEIADGRERFAQAIRAKLVQEIASLGARAKRAQLR